MTHSEILDELQEAGMNEDDMFFEKVQFVDVERKTVPDLPEDSINLLDPVQVSHHNKEKIFSIAERFIEKRRLRTAAYRPKSYYLSISDFMHKNRLIIPFYGFDGNIIYYQSRALLHSDEEKGKYFFKLGAEHKEVFNLDKIDIDHDRIYKFEGTLDCIFVKNGISCGGVNETSYQTESIERIAMFQDSVYVFDNPVMDKTAKEKIGDFIDEGKSVFLWGPEFIKYKDFAQKAEEEGIDEIPPSLIDKYVFSGKKARQYFDRLLLHH